MLFSTITGYTFRCSQSLSKASPVSNEKSFLCIGQATVIFSPLLPTIPLANTFSFLWGHLF
jgi:hypothetical protein